jgi:hypothetical protein
MTPLVQSLPQVTTEAAAAPPAVSQQIDHWTTAPELLQLLQLAQVVSALILWVRRMEGRLLPARSGQGSGEPIYTDVQILLTMIVQAVWQLSQRDVCRWLKQYPQLAEACGYGVSQTISQSHYSRRIRQLGLTVWVIYFLWLVRQLLAAGVIVARDLCVDSTVLTTEFGRDADARFNAFYKKFGYKVHTVLCRISALPVWFLITPASAHDNPPGVRLLRQVVQIIGRLPEVVRADAAYFSLEFIGLILSWGARAAVDYNVRRAGKKFLLPLWFVRWWKHRMGKRATIERFFGIVKRWYGLEHLRAPGYLSGLRHVLMTYGAVLTVALLAVKRGRPEWRLSPKKLLAPC